MYHYDRRSQEQLLGRGAPGPRALGPGLLGPRAFGSCTLLLFLILLDHGDAPHSNIPTLISDVCLLSKLLAVAEKQPIMITVVCNESYVSKEGN